MTKKQKPTITKVIDIFDTRAMRYIYAIFWQAEIFRHYLRVNELHKFYGISLISH